MTAATNVLREGHAGSQRFYFRVSLRKFGCKTKCEQTVLSGVSVHMKGARACTSVLGTDKDWVYECVSISVGLLISHPPAALVHQQRCHVAEQIPCLMDECVLLPTRRPPLLASHKFLRRIFPFLKPILFIFALLHARDLCLSEDITTPVLGLVE